MPSRIRISPVKRYQHSILFVPRSDVVKSSTVYLARLPVQRAKRLPKCSKVWLILKASIHMMGTELSIGIGTGIVTFDTQP